MMIMVSTTGGGFGGTAVFAAVEPANSGGGNALNFAGWLADVITQWNLPDETRAVQEEDIAFGPQKFIAARGNRSTSFGFTVTSYFDTQVHAQNYVFTVADQYATANVPSTVNVDVQVTTDSGTNKVLSNGALVRCKVVRWENVVVAVQYEFQGLTSP